MMGLQSMERLALIKREDLSPNQYTLSLLKEAYRMGFIDRRAIEGIQAQIILILKDLIMRYTRGESTSVRVESAERILNSIYYSVDACTKGIYNPEDCINLLETKKIREIYEEGIGIVTFCLSQAKVLYKGIMDRKLDVSLKAYNSTLEEAMPDFFKHYNPVFDAHDTMAGIDYPLVFDDMNITGVFYIRRYLKTLDIETRVCSLFPKEDIEKVLINYGSIYRIDYREPLINIFELLVNNSIFSVLSGNNGDRLIISKLQYELLNRKLTSLSSYEMGSLVDEAVDRMIKDLSICQIEQIDYIYRYKTVFIQRLISAAENRSLQNIIVASNEEMVQDSSVTFEEGNRMEDDSFRSLIGRIKGCKNISEKINMLSSSIDSLEDFIDALNGDCLYGDEFIALFTTLNDMELSMLGRMVFFEDLRGGLLNLSPRVIRRKEKEIESEWQMQYMTFIKGLSMDRVKLIEGFINVIA